MNIGEALVKQVYRDEIASSLGEGGQSRKRYSREKRRMMLAMLAGTPARALEPRGETWVWSDLHLGHANILRYTDRPFADVDEMDASLHAHYASTVGVDDTSICVGDFAFGAALCDATWARVRTGNGREKHLVVGNHDLTKRGDVIVRGFDYVSSVLWYESDPPLIFTHFPLRGMPDGWVNVHGHTHHKRPVRSAHINVCVEQTGYRPVALRRLCALAKVLASGAVPEGETTVDQLERLGV